MTWIRAIMKKPATAVIFVGSVLALVGVLVTPFVTGLFGLQEAAIPIRATQTAEARLTEIAQIGISQAAEAGLTETAAFQAAQAEFTSAIGTPSLENVTPVPSPSTNAKDVNEIAFPANFFILSQDNVASDDFSKTTSGWGIDKTDDNNVSGYDPDSETLYMFLGDSAGYFSVFWEWAANKFDTPDEISFQVDALGPFGENGAEKQGIVFGVNSWQDRSYAFDITHDGWCRLVTRDNLNPWTVAEDPLTGEKIINAINHFDNSQPQTLTVRIEGKNFRGYVNGEHCLFATIAEYRPGHIGVVGKGAKDGVVIFFDNFKIFLP